ncbi:MAG: hypothetical protein FJW37_00645 [Acidobacteria bacterium]|nr:hypothetical protein [Acidobacteriota bacterium]
MPKTQAFFWGCFGSAAPEVIKYYRLAADRQPLPGEGWVLYIAMSLIFILFSGGFTVAFRPENEYKAIWAGASFPAIFAALAQAIPSR